MDEGLQKDAFATAMSSSWQWVDDSKNEGGTHLFDYVGKEKLVYHNSPIAYNHLPFVEYRFTTIIIIIFNFWFFIISIFGERSFVSENSSIACT